MFVSLVSFQAGGLDGRRRSNGTGRQLEWFAAVGAAAGVSVNMNVNVVVVWVGLSGTVVQLF